MSLIDAVADVVVAAGRKIEEVRASAHLAVSQKGAEGPVTAADRQADTFLRAELPKLVDAAWLSEETADDKTRLTARRLWVVDPLDGTKEFIAGMPEYAVAVGLVEDGRVILAVTHNPSTGETYRAALGEGALLDGRPIRCRGGLTLLASRSETKRGEFAPFSEVGFKLRPIGSIAYKLALVARGDAAITLSRGPKWEWDVCAGSLLVTEAGGRATDLLGGPLRFNNAFPKVRGIIAGETSAHARARELVARVGASDRMAELMEGTQ